ncbi:MAG: hypothetical protein ACLQJ0_04980 [Steroidobacteraceae bacterium]
MARWVPHLQARGIEEPTQPLPMSDRQADGQHLTPEGHRIVAVRSSISLPRARALIRNER